jgi:predicted AlkP superfamily pyrophosphatase or phosphodiesterase
VVTLATTFIDAMKVSVFAFLLVLLIGCAAMRPAATTPTNSSFSRPKVIIGITVDQMRYDYIDKYWNDFSDKGFKRLLKEGFFARNLTYNYMPTYTGPGHASIFTGTTPCMHGIIQNDWYEKSSGLTIYCSSDSTVTGVGTSGKAGQMSPHYLTASTLGDELRLFTNEQSKVFGIAMKDRGAILPAGRTADAAYWFVGLDEGVWASSSWYMQDLPQWVKDFNAKRIPDEYMKSTWNLLKDESVYNETHADNNPFETPFRGTLKPVFPYDLNAMRSTNGNYDLIKATPFGNTLTVEFAKSLIENENLGKDEFTDMLCMSFSATDYIGHQFGIHARELQDCYLRLDLEIAAFIDYLDQKFGRDQYMVFLSADHGGAPTPSYIMKEQGTGGYWKSETAEYFLEEELAKSHGTGDWILNESNLNVFLNHALILERKLNLRDVQQEVADLLLMKYPEVQFAFTASDIAEFKSGHLIREMVSNGFSQKQSGDVIYVLQSGYMEYGMTGTTHGSPFRYDSHVPAIFFGANIKPGESFTPHSITDIAPTVAAACKMPFPNACTGNPITEAIK